MECPWCEKKFDTIKKLHGHKATCKKSRRANHLFQLLFLNKKFFQKYYIEEGLSAYKISNSILKHIDQNKINHNAGLLILLLKHYGLKSRNFSETALLESTRKSYRETCIKKYGDINALGKKSPIYHKRNNTIKEKYGVDNAFQIRNEKGIPIAVQATRDKYNIFCPNELDSYKANCGKKSKPHILVEKYLEEKSISYISEMKGMDNKTFLKYNEHFRKLYAPRPDIIIDKIVIEIYGDKWHCNPKKYKPNDMVYLWDGETTAKEKWKYDKHRKEHIESFGYKVYEIWASEISQGKIDDILGNIS